MDRDEELVSRIQAGEMQAFNTLIKAHYDRTYRTVMRRVPAEDAEDVTQDIFLNLVGSIDSFQGRSAFTTWFNKIIVNRVADYHRRTFRYKSRFTSEEEMRKHEPCEDANVDVEIEDLLMKLPKPYREVLMMKFRYDLSFTEIASSLGLTYEAAHSRYRRAIIYASKGMSIK